jgi:hypothetical protein
MRAPIIAGLLAMTAAFMPGDQGGCHADPTLVASPDEPGPQLPPAGRSLFDEIFATDAGHGVTYPFERLVDVLNARLAPATVTSVLIPLGRSLQRYEAAPDFFHSPRIVLAADSDGTAALADALLRDRLYLGYQPAVNAIEVISYNEDAGRFEFQRVTDYGEGLTPKVSSADREVCTGCHQGHGPIFPRPLWSETNANQVVAARLSELGARYHGVPVHQGIDAPDRFDRSTDRANRIAVINRLWNDGCGGGQEGLVCRAELFRAALEFRLGGARSDWPVPAAALPARLHQRLSTLWPDGLAVPSPDLPNRDPFAAFADAATRSRPLDVKGAEDPLTPRPALLQWKADADTAATYEALVRDIADAFAAADVAWLDGRLVQLAAEPIQIYRAVCQLDSVALDKGRQELRLHCSGADGLRLEGFLVVNGTRIEGGRIEDLSIDDASHIRRLRIEGAENQSGSDPGTLRAVLRESASGLSARLPGLVRLTALTLNVAGPSLGTVEISAASEAAPLGDAIAGLVAAGAPSLSAGPLRRRALLADLQQALTVR